MMNEDEAHVACANSGLNEKGGFAEPIVMDAVIVVNKLRAPPSDQVDYMHRILKTSAAVAIKAPFF